MPYLLYVSSTLGAVALLMMMPRRGYTPLRLGILLGAATLGLTWLFLFDHLELGGLSGAAMVYYYIFSALAIGAAARVVTHTRPVYAALWFIMVVLASAGLFLVLEAEFMALAMIIIYAGAILVTYVFVIMLASQAADPEVGDDGADYDRVAREPAAAVVVGFLLLAVLLRVAFPLTDDERVAPRAEGADDASIIARHLVDRSVARVAGGADADERYVLHPALHTQDRLDNVERIGLDLFRMHPLGLELAGVILLVALVGAVVIARTRVDDPEPHADAHDATS